jgi:aminopeptidase YwaD
MVGSQYPFSLLEDGDFGIPSVYMTAEEGIRLAAHAGLAVSLESRAMRIPASGCNVIARKGARQDRRIVLFAHIDARLGTPGASDNASGTTVLLLLAELLAGYAGSQGLELVAMNGEDYYSNPREQQWLGMNAGRFSEILLGSNIDDVGYIGGKTAYSLYDCPTELADPVRGVFSAHESLIEGEPWYQGDHGLFLMNQIPALAITSASVEELMAEFTHTPQDTSDILDAAKIAAVAVALRDLVLRLDQKMA